MRYLAKNFPELSEAARKDVVDFLNALDGITTTCIVFMRRCDRLLPPVSHVKPVVGV